MFGTKIFYKEIFPPRLFDKKKFYDQKNFKSRKMLIQKSGNKVFFLTRRNFRHINISSKNHFDQNIF